VRSAQPRPEVDPFGPRTRRRVSQRPKHDVRWWLVTAIVALVVTYGLYVGSMAIYEKVVNSTVVEDYVGMEVTAAQRAVARDGLKAEVVEINHPTISAGTVILQAPVDGITLRKGDAVVLTISKGPATQTMPYFLNMPLTDAITTAQAYGLTLTVVERVVSPTVKADFILSQVPEAGTECNSGDIVQVTVSGGLVYVPDLSGKSLNEARETIAGLGLSLNANIAYVETEDASLHSSIAFQSPAADTAVIQGTSVSLSLYRVPALLHRAKVILDLPQSEGLTSVRVTISDGDWEYTVYKADFPANASRRPEVELVAQEAGVYTYRVYFNEKFAYQQQVEMP